ncbi:MAG: hypothetical protein IJ079_03830 [Lachnospiraceae bacterium]|nr:hypothetical protein [Lachnospiraceae bacterium]MBR1567538.1 hypothetical protein [Lachnospiraceae bacterium]MBR1568694.1 hypothetical protein [Lachnospiraceae bacterium]
MSKLTEVAERQIIRKEILDILAETDQEGASTKVLKLALSKQGHELTDLTLNLELKYLQGKNLVQLDQVSNPALGIHRTIVHITSRGIDVLEGTIQVEGIEVGE